MPPRSRPGAGPAIAEADEALLRAAGLQHETDRAFEAARASGWGRDDMAAYYAKVAEADAAAEAWQDLAAGAATEAEAGLPSTPGPTGPDQTRRPRDTARAVPDHEREGPTRCLP